MNPILINGKAYTWADLKFILFGIPVAGITKVDYTRDRESTNNYGAGSEPVSYGNKNFVYSGSITVELVEVQRILKTAPGRSILEIPPSSAILMFSGDGIDFITHTINNIRFTKDPFSASQNDSQILITLPFVYAGLLKS